MAKPKIANYAFTTIHPNLGVVLLSDYEKFVVADLPGLIIGASTGAGLGIQFLKHISRTKLLLNVIDISKNNIDGAIRDVDVIARELKGYNEELGKKDKWYIFNKIDIVFKIPYNLKKIIRICNNTDWIQFRAPTNLGLYVLPYISYFSNYKDEDQMKLVFSSERELYVEICDLLLSECQFDMLSIKDYSELLEGRYSDGSVNSYIFIGNFDQCG